MQQKDFVKKWVEIIKNEILKKFPDDFLTLEETTIITLPAATLTIGSELFGSFEICDISGNLVYQANNYDEAKYLLYSNRHRPTELKLPVEGEKISHMVSQYDMHLDEIIRKIKGEFENEFPTNILFDKISNAIFNNLQLQRY